MIVNTMSCGNHIRYEVKLKTRSLEEKMGEDFPSNLTEEARKKLEYIYDDPVQDLIDAINNHHGLHGMIKAKKI